MLVDQRNSVIVAHITLYFDISILIKLRYPYILLGMLDSMACLLFLEFLLLNSFLCCNSWITTLMYVNWLIKSLDIDIPFFFVYKSTKLRLYWLSNLGFPLFLPVKKLIFKFFLIHLVLFCPVHSLQILVESLLLIFLVDGSLEFTESRVRRLQCVIDIFRLHKIRFKSALGCLFLLSFLVFLRLFKS